MSLSRHDVKVVKGEIVDCQEATCPRGHALKIAWVATKGKFAFVCERCDEVSPVAICGEWWIEIQRRKRVQ